MRTRHNHKMNQSVCSVTPFAVANIAPSQPAGNLQTVSQTMTIEQSRLAIPGGLISVALTEGWSLSPLPEEMDEIHPGMGSYLVHTSSSVQLNLRRLSFKEDLLNDLAAQLNVRIAERRLIQQKNFRVGH